MTSNQVSSFHLKKYSFDAAMTPLKLSKGMVKDPRKDSYGNNRNRFVEGSKLFCREYEREMQGKDSPQKFYETPLPGRKVSVEFSFPKTRRQLCLRKREDISSLGPQTYDVLNSISMVKQIKGLSFSKSRRNFDLTTVDPRSGCYDGQKYYK